MRTHDEDYPYTPEEKEEIKKNMGVAVIILLILIIAGSAINC